MSLRSKRALEIDDIQRFGMLVNMVPLGSGKKGIDALQARTDLGQVETVSTSERLVQVVFIPPRMHRCLTYAACSA